MTPSSLAIASLLCGPATSDQDRPPAAPADAIQPGDGEPSGDDPPAPDRLEQVETRLDALAEDNEHLRQDNEHLRQDNEQLRQDNEQLRRDAEQRQREQLEQRVESLEQEQAQARQQLDGLLPLSSRLGGYLDVGFFWVGGDGSGIRPDTGHVHFPEYDGVVPDSWVFMGDPLSTQINSRGDPADTGESRAVVFDPVDSRGNATFIANALNLDLTTGVGDDLVVEGMVDFMPRNRDVSNPDGVQLGDFVNVKLAYVDYIVPVRRFDLDLYVGKIDSVMGYEYRIQESPDRITVTPSLLCRYTCGRPVGLKARAKLLPRRALIVAMALTNGSSFGEGFGFSNEIDTNDSKTVAGRLSYRLPVGAGLEIGSSGQIGAQDLQPSNDRRQWQYGFDLHLDVRGVEVTGEFVMGKVGGTGRGAAPECDSAACLGFKGAYGLVGYRVLNWLMPYARVDWRDALHQQGASFAYISDLMRVTGGARFDLGTHVAIKLEYVYNRELGRVPSFDNDVVTSSLVAKI